MLRQADVKNSFSMNIPDVSHLISNLTFIADVDVVAAGVDISACIIADRDVAAARGVAEEGVRSRGRVVYARGVADEGERSGGGVGAAQVAVSAP